jgi:hypothetical protein
MAREAARRIACFNNLKQLGLACQNYHSSHGSFPPGAVGGLGPKFPQYLHLRNHGLATHLLPDLEQASLFNQYNWDASWWDPPNQTVVNARLEVFMCPSAQANRVVDGSLPTVQPPGPEPFKGTAACGDYAGMSAVDPELVLRGLIDPTSSPLDVLGRYEGVFTFNRIRGLDDIPDGTSKTILIAECAGRPQLWQGTGRLRTHGLPAAPGPPETCCGCEAQHRTGNSTGLVPSIAQTIGKSTASTPAGLASCSQTAAYVFSMRVSTSASLPRS